jgi:hypothetical protein
MLAGQNRGLVLACVFYWNGCRISKGCLSENSIGGAMALRENTSGQCAPLSFGDFSMNRLAWLCLLSLIGIGLSLSSARATSPIVKKEKPKATAEQFPAIFAITKTFVDELGGVDYTNLEATEKYRKQDALRTPLWKAIDGQVIKFPAVIQAVKLADKTEIELDPGALPLNGLGCTWTPSIFAASGKAKLKLQLTPEQAKLIAPGKTVLFTGKGQAPFVEQGADDACYMTLSKNGIDLKFKLEKITLAE